jgi:hypothetical protein
VLLFYLKRDVGRIYLIRNFYEDFDHRISLTAKQFLPSSKGQPQRLLPSLASHAKSGGGSQGMSADQRGEPYDYSCPDRLDTLLSLTRLLAPE